MMHLPPPSSPTVQAQAAIAGRAGRQGRPLREPILKPLWAAYSVSARGRDERDRWPSTVPERKVLAEEDGLVDRIFVPPPWMRTAHRRVHDPG
jgi:ribonuclease R